MTFTFNGRKNEWGEYVVKAYKDGKRYPDADYFTDDKTDALETLKALRVS